MPDSADRAVSRETRASETAPARWKTRYFPTNPRSPPAMTLSALPDAAPLHKHLQTVLGPLPPPAMAAASAGACLRLRPGDALLRDGERWQHLWWVERGALRLYYLDRNGQASNKNFFLDGSMLWPITPDLADRPVGFWVEALEHTVVWALPWRTWQAAAAGEAWQNLERRVLAALLQDKMRREQQFLQDSATERYRSLQDQHPEWAQRLPLKHLASYLGVTDVALSRIRRRLARPPAAD